MRDHGDSDDNEATCWPTQFSYKSYVKKSREGNVDHSWWPSRSEGIWNTNQGSRYSGKAPSRMREVSPNCENNRNIIKKTHERGYHNHVDRGM